MVQAEGLRGLYRGFLPAVVGTIPGVSLYFLSYEKSKHLLESKVGKDSHMVNFAAGLMAETVSCAVWVPTDILKERSQAAGVKSVPPVGVMIRKILSEEGVRGVYRGYGATLASFGPFSAFYFMFVEEIKSNWKRASGTDHLSFPQLVISCAIAGGSAALVTAPLDLIKVRLQVERRAAAGKSSYPNMIEGLKHVLRKEGMRGLFRGGASRVWFAVPNTAITMSIMESIKNRLESSH